MACSKSALSAQLHCVSTWLLLLTISTAAAEAATTSPIKDRPVPENPSQSYYLSPRQILVNLKHNLDLLAFRNPADHVDDATEGHGTDEKQPATRNYGHVDPNTKLVLEVYDDDNDATRIEDADQEDEQPRRSCLLLEFQYKQQKYVGSSTIPHDEPSQLEIAVKAKTTEHSFMSTMANMIPGHAKQSEPEEIVFSTTIPIDPSKTKRMIKRLVCQEFPNAPMVYEIRYSDLDGFKGPIKRDNIGNFSGLEFETRIRQTNFASRSISMQLQFSTQPKNAENMTLKLNIYEEQANRDYRESNGDLGEYSPETLAGTLIHSVAKVFGDVQDNAGRFQEDFSKTSRTLYLSPCKLYRFEIVSLRESEIIHTAHVLSRVRMNRIDADTQVLGGDFDSLIIQRSLSSALISLPFTITDSQPVIDCLLPNLQSIATLQAGDADCDLEVLSTYMVSERSGKSIIRVHSNQESDSPVLIRLQLMQSEPQVVRQTEDDDANDDADYEQGVPGFSTSSSTGISDPLDAKLDDEQQNMEDEEAAMPALDLDEGSEASVTLPSLLFKPRLSLLINKLIYKQFDNSIVGEMCMDNSGTFIESIVAKVLPESRPTRAKVLSLLNKQDLLRNDRQLNCDLAANDSLKISFEPTFDTHISCDAITRLLTKKPASDAKFEINYVVF
ncbi:MAG: hypothetical protein MHMPM18_002207 [Marteilia pararefringens]